MGSLFRTTRRRALQVIGAGTLASAGVGVLSQSWVDRVQAPGSLSSAVIPAFVQGHKWTVDGAWTYDLNDTSQPVIDSCGQIIGLQHVRFTTLGNGFRARTTWTGPPLNLEGNLVRLWLRADDITHLSHAYLYLGNKDLSSYWVIDFWIPQGKPTHPLLGGVWQTYTLDPLDFADIIGRPELTAIATLRFSVVDDATGQPLTFRFGGLEIVPKSTAFPRGVMSITFDDGFANQFLLAMPKMGQYGYAATAYVIQDLIEPNGVGSYLNLSQLKILQSSMGWEIAAHASTIAIHNAPGGMTSLTDEQLEGEFTAMQRWLTENGFLGTSHFAYPQGLFDQRVLEVTKRYFASARVARHSPILETLPPTDGDGRLKLRTFILDSSQPLEHMQLAVDSAAVHGGWLIFMAHDVVASEAGVSQVTESTFTGLIDYIAASGVPVMPIGQVLAAL